MQCSYVVLCCVRVGSFVGLRDRCVFFYTVHYCSGFKCTTQGETILKTLPRLS